MKKNMTWGHGSMNLLSNNYLEIKKKNMTWGHGSMNLLSNKYLRYEKTCDLVSWEYESVIKWILRNEKNMWLEIMGVWICYQINTYKWKNMWLEVMEVWIQGCDYNMQMWSGGNDYKYWQLWSTTNLCLRVQNYKML
jgi:hypothetical protein